MEIMDKNQPQIQQAQFEIEKLNIRTHDDFYSVKGEDDTIIEFIKKCDDNFGLKCLDVSLTHSFQEKLMTKVLFNSIKFLAIHDAGLDSNSFQIKHLIDFLSSDIMFDKKLFVGVYDVRFRNCKNKSLFDQLCQTIYQLLIKQIPIDIAIEFEKFDILDELHSQLCFGTDEFLSQYKKPKCENDAFCSPRGKPLARFSPFCGAQSEDDLFVLQVTNCDSICHSVFHKFYRCHFGWACSNMCMSY